MNDPITNTDIDVCPLESTFEEQNKPVQREEFLDFFPNVCNKYKGFILNATFRSKMERVILNALNLAGTFTDLCMKEMILMTGLLDTRCVLARQNYLQDIKSYILLGISVEEWNVANETNMGEQMNNQSRNYYKEAGKEAAMQIVSLGLGKAIKHGAKALNVESVRLSKQRIPGTGFSASSRVQKVGDFPFNYSASANFTLRGHAARNVTFKGVENNTKASITLLEFDLINQVTDKSINLFADNVADTSNYDSYNCFDLSKYGVNKKVNKALDVATDFIPNTSWTKTIFNVTGNVLLGIRTGRLAKQMQKWDTANNNRLHDFNANLKQIIYNDMYLLDLNEVEELIGVCGMKEMIK